MMKGGLSLDRAYQVGLPLSRCRVRCVRKPLNHWSRDPFLPLRRCLLATLCCILWNQGRSTALRQQCVQGWRCKKLKRYGNDISGGERKSSGDLGFQFWTKTSICFQIRYHGCSLLDAIDSLQLPHRDLSKPLCLPICDVITIPSTGHVSACGKLENGAIRKGLKVLVLPSGDLATVQSIERDSQACSIARAGDHVTVNLQVLDGAHVITGGIVCHPEFPVKVTSSLELKVLVLDITTPIGVGCRVEFQAHHAMEAARVRSLVSLLDQKTGKVLTSGPPFLTAKQSAVIEVDLDGPVCVEEFSICRALGRVFLRASGNTIAVGIITRVLEGTS